MFTGVRNGLNGPSSNPGQGCLHFFCGHTLGKRLESIFSLSSSMVEYWAL